MKNAVWDDQPLKTIARVTMGQSPSSADCNSEGIGEPFLQGSADFGERFPKPTQFCPTATKYADVGDLLLSVRAPVGTMNRADRRVGIGRGLCSIRATSARQDFVAYAIQARVCELLSVATGSTYQAVSIEQVANLRLPVPSSAALQTAIAVFLDRETGKIDALVEEQKRLIKLLKEKRQAVISHAVTKGLDPNVRIKPSGVEWLGHVPQHWQTLQVRRLLARIEQGWSPDCESRTADFSEWGVLKAGCANGSVFREEENKALPTDLEAKPELEVRAGDILMSRANGSPENVGATAYVSTVRPRLMLSDKIFRLHAVASVRPKYLALLLRSLPLRRQIEQAISGADGLANNLPQSALKTFATALPPIDEQEAITDHAEAQLNALSALADHAAAAIELLVERRSTLISAAVTGKIDVRDLNNREAAA